jgi:hypothetical protein
LGAKAFERWGKFTSQRIEDGVGGLFLKIRFENL